MASSLKMRVKCREGEVLEVDEALVNASQTLKRLIEEKCSSEDPENEMITWPDISRKTLSMINEYVKKHADADAADAAPSTSSSKSLKKSLDAWDAKFIKVDLDTLYDLLLAANYLKIQNLLDLACNFTVDKMKGKTAEQIRQIFNIQSDFTPEEEEENRRRLQWFEAVFKYPHF